MISKRVLNMTPSATSTLGGKIAEMKSSGIDVTAFHLGEPDFNTPQKIVDACKKALDEGKTKYIAVAGILPLRKAITEKLQKDNNITYTPKQICVGTGAKQVLANAIMAICNEGDEFIIPTPCWVSYVEMVKLAQGIPILVPTKEDFQLDIKAIEKAITKKTKAIIINTPNNPTGAAYTEQSLKKLAKIVVQHDIYVISDEVYEKLIYEGKHHSIASFSKEIYERTITINGFSKAYSMTGWRLGYAAASIDIIKAITSLQSHTTTNAATFVQWAAITALQQCDIEIEQMREEFHKRRDVMLDCINRIEGLHCSKPQGAFYLMPDISTYIGKKYGKKTIRNSFDFCDYILEEANVAIVPGAAFEMPNTVRIAYSVSIETIQQGMCRIETALKKLK